MLDSLLIGCTGYFFAVAKPLNQKAIDDLFEELRDSVENPGPSLIRQIRGTAAGILYSVICFPYDRLPPFLDKSLVHRDRVHGFMLLVEAQGYVAIIKSRFELPTEFRSQWLTRVESGRLEAAIATADAIFQKIRIKPMMTSRTALQAKTLEANNLANAMPMGSASRSVAQGYTVRRGPETYSTTPSTGHISKRTDKANYEAAVSWARTVIEALDTATPNVGGFIENFARQVNLAALKAEDNASCFAIDIAELSDRLFSDNATIKLVRKLKPNLFEDMAVKQTEALLHDLDKNFSITGTNADLKLNDDNHNTIGTLKWGKTRIALSTFDMHESTNVYVAPKVNGSADHQNISLKMYIDRNDLFIVIFDDISFAYINGELFQDKAISDGGQVFINQLIPDSSLNNTKSEKGDFHPKQKQFSKESVFRKVIDNIAADHDVLICDDLGDEWADFIALDTTGKPPRISFFHAKHGALSLGASPFHISVSQAAKNLGRLSLAEPDFAKKFASWKKPYRGETVTTLIPRVVRGGSKAQIMNHARKLRTSPETVKRVLIVTSSLSVKNVRKVFTDIKKGGKPNAHFVQLYWLLMSYFSNCAEVGAIGYVVCRP